MLALLTASLLFLLPGGPLLAQDSSIEYPEKGEVAVATFTATDPEMAGAIAWSLSGDDAEDFEIDKASGVLTFAEVPDYEMAADDDTNNVYTVTVVATDADGMMSEKAVTVTVTNVDEDGTVTLSAVAPYPGVILTTMHTDPDRQIAGAEWQWSRSISKGGSYADIENAEAATYSPTSGDVGFYLRASVAYTDGHGEGKSAMATSAHTVQAINLPNATPEFADDDADTIGNQTTRMVEENTPAGMDVGLPVEASDGDDDILTYTLGDTAADDAFDIEAATGQIKTKDELDADTAATYAVTVTATDPAGMTDEITVTITVTGVNEPPDITGDVDDYAETTADDPNAADVADFTATDPEGETPAPTFDLSGADSALFALSDAGVLTFDSPPNFEAPGDADKDNTYELTVGARDADGIRGTRDIEVKVTNENEAGTVTLSAVQPRVGVAVTASLTDIDGQVSGVTWQWSVGGSAIADATSDTYTPTATDSGALTATAMYTDPQGPEKTANRVSTNPVAADTRNKAPVFDDQDDETDGTQNDAAERTVEENTVAPNPVSGGAVTATDPNTGDILSYSLGGDDASSFDVGLTTGQIMVGTGTELDYETKDTYMVTVIATDSFGVTASIAVTITVTDINEGPEVTGRDQVDYAEKREVAVATYTATDPENAGAVTWSLEDAADAEDFEIGKSSGVLTFAEVPDYEMAADGDTNNVYTVTVVATDADGMMSEKAVTVTVTNVDEDGTVSLSAVAPYPGVDLTATHSDLDGSVVGAEWQWSRSRSRGGSYADIENAEAATYSPTSGDVGFYLRATVTYNDGQGEGKRAMATSAHTVQSINEPNADPVFPDQDPGTTGDQSDTATRMVEENTAAGEDVGLPVVAEDGDDDILTYTLGDTAADDAFDIEAATGQITTKAELNTETTPTYAVTVTATDPAGMTDVITVTITVTGVNEPPDITGDVDDYAETTADDPNTADVADFTATDPESAGAVTFDLSGADSALFALSDAGVLTFDSPPNFEAPGDADKDNTYELTVGARDADGNRGTRDIEVKVTNENEAGTVTLSAVQPRVGVAVTASLTDIDGQVSGVTWQWSVGGSAIADATSDTYTPTATDSGALTATAMYTDPQGPEKTANRVSTNPVAADTRNKAPVFDDQDDETDGTQNDAAERTVEENTVAPNPVSGGAVTATDPNTGDILSYSLGGDDASSFDVGLTTGQIMVGTGTELDFETKITYMVTVIATDSFGVTASIPVTITVTDINEGPEIRRAPNANVAPEFDSATTSRTVAENTVAGQDIGNPVAASDANRDALTYALSGADAASFDIEPDTTGQLVTLAPLDYETKATYSVTVTASDSGGLSDSIDVTITVTNVDDPGAVNLSSQAPVVGTALTASLTDDDDDITEMTWQWASSDAMDGTFTPIEGATSSIYTPVADDVGKHLRATASYTDGEGSDKSEIATSANMVTAADTRDPLLAEYDPNADGVIEKADMRLAVADYFGQQPTLTKPDMRRLVAIYFS